MEIWKTDRCRDIEMERYIHREMERKKGGEFDVQAVVEKYKWK